MAKDSSLQVGTLALDAGALAVADPAVAATIAVRAALEYSAEKMALTGPQAALDCLRAGDENAHSYFQYALAQHAAYYLASFDEEITAAYMYDYEATPEDQNFGQMQALSPVHLIVSVRRKTEALFSLAASLDRALAERYASQAGLSKTGHLLDVQVIDEADVQRGTGYGALLNSIYHRPMLVWQR